MTSRKRESRICCSAFTDGIIYIRKAFEADDFTFFTFGMYTFDRYVFKVLKTITLAGLFLY